MVENSIDDIEQRRVMLRSFLRAARERVRPEEHCLPSRTRRRTPGLRREDVAELAGVSTAWYTLLETARNRRVSTRMLDRVANALMLSDAEKLQLYSLAFPEIPSLASTDSSAAHPAATLKIYGRIFAHFGHPARSAKRPKQP